MIIVKIKRQHNFESEPYWQSFHYNGPEHVTVSALLDTLNYTDDLFDTDGKAASRIRWECSCMQAMCGGCAMVILSERVSYENRNHHLNDENEQKIKFYLAIGETYLD